MAAALGQQQQEASQQSLLQVSEALRAELLPLKDWGLRVVSEAWGARFESISDLSFRAETNVCEAGREESRPLG